MKTTKDAYGQELLAFISGQDSFEIVERADGFIGTSPGAPAYFAEFKDWPKSEKQAIKFAKGHVLDIGTGAGRVALYLQQKKLQVTATDNSPLAIKVCKQRGVKNAQVLPIEQINKLKGKVFDTVVLLGNNFGLFGNFRKAQTLLKALHKITNPDAVMIAGSTDPYKTNASEHLTYHDFNLKRGRMAGQLRIRIRFRKYASDWFDYLLVSKEEMQKILKGTGWEIHKFIDSGKASYCAIIRKI